MFYEYFGDASDETFSSTYWTRL